MYIYRIKYIFLLLLIVTSLHGQSSIKESPRDTSFNIVAVQNKIKKYFPTITPADTNLPVNVIAHRELVYATLVSEKFGKRDMHLDIFEPKEKGIYPVLLLIHGGGWRSGDKSLQEPLAKQIASRGYVTVTVEYQLLLEAQYPAAIHNIKAAIRWLRANAEKYSINSNKVAISGCSAGGQLASLVGVTNNVSKFEGSMGLTGFSSEVQAIIDIDGVINFLAPNSLNLKRNQNSPDVEWLGGTFEDIPSTWKEASPIYWVNENTPPILIIKSGLPRFTAGSDELVGILEGFKVFYQVQQMDVKVHPFWLFKPWFEITVNHMSTFLDTVFFEE